MKAVEDFTRKHYWPLLFIIISCLKLFYAPLVSEDLFIWVASGLKMIDLGGIINRDYFTIHQNLNFIYPAQLSNLFYGAIFKLGGSNLLFFTLRSLGILLVVIIYKKYLVAIEKNLTNLIISILFVFGIFYMLDRPQYLAFIPAVLTLSYLDQELNSIKPKMYFFILIVFWSNIHSSVLILLPILFARIFAEVIFRKFELVKSTIQKIVLVILGITLTPIGLDIFSYLNSTFSLSSKRFSGEWRSLLQFHDSFLVFLILILIFFLIYRLLKENKLQQYFLSGYYVLPIMILISVRHAIFFCLINFLLFSRLNLWISGKNILNNSRLKSFVGILILLSLYLISINWSNNNFLDENYDHKLITYLKNEKPLRIYHEIDGGLLETFLYKSNHQYFIDARNIIFSDEMYIDYADLKMNRNLSTIIKKYNFSAFIVKKENLVMIESLLNLGWEEIFAGDKTILFKKRA